MGLQLFIQHSIDHEVLNTSSFIDNEAFLSFGLSPKDKELPALAILKYVQNWIQKYCETKVAENFLLLHFAIKDEFYKVEVESMLLTMNNPVIMISEDWGLINKEKNFKIMNIESFLKLTQPKNIKQISEWLGNMHFAGVDVNENYMYEQYMKERKNQIHSALV